MIIPRNLVNLVEHPRTWNFFQGMVSVIDSRSLRKRNDLFGHPLSGKGQLTTEEFPFDLDTTSLGLTILKRGKDTANSVMNEMLEYVDPDGIIQVSIM